MPSQQFFGKLFDGKLAGEPKKNLLKQHGCLKKKPCENLRWAGSTEVETDEAGQKGRFLGLAAW